MPTASINRFNGGMNNDSRVQSDNSARIITNFDVLNIPHSLTPNNATENGDQFADARQKFNFCIGSRVGSEYVLYGIGRDVPPNGMRIEFKDLTTGGVGDLGDDVWQQPVNNQLIGSQVYEQLFVYYNATEKIYFARGSLGVGTDIMVFDTNGTPVASDLVLTFNTIAQGLVHSKDNILYVPYDNKIATNNAGVWTSVALSGLPDDMYITSISEYNNFLAIGMSPLSGVGNSKVYLWDRDTSIVVLSEVLDAGVGVIKAIEEIDGNLVTVSQHGGFVPGTQASLVQEVVFRVYASGQMTVFNKIIMETNDPLAMIQIPQARCKSNSKLYFLLQGKLNGEKRCGVFSIGREYQGTQLSIVQEITHNNDVPMVNGVLTNLILVDGIFFVAYNDEGVYYVSKTNADYNFQYHTGIYESLINAGMTSGDRYKSKKLIGVLVNHQALTTGQEVVVKYRVDSAPDGAWTTVLTSNTVGSVSFDTSLLANGTQFTDGTEYEFRIESTGGAIITNFAYKYQNLNELV